MDPESQLFLEGVKVIRDPTAVFERTDGPGESTVITQKVPLEAVRPDPGQSRTTFDLEELAELQDSLRERGLINPISLREIDEDSSGIRYEIIAGERRYRAARALGWNDIEARVWPRETPALEAELISLVENLQRVDLNPIEEAKGYRQLTKPPYNLNQIQIAKALGKDNTLIARALALLDLPQEIQDSLSRDKLSEGQIRYLKRLKDPQQMLLTARQAKQEGWSVKETERRVNQLIGRDERAEKEAAKAQVVKLMADADADPLAPTWVRLSKDPWIARAGVWKVSYRGGLRWNLEVKPGTGDPAAAGLRLAEWLRKMADALENR